MSTRREYGRRRPAMQSEPTIRPPSQSSAPQPTSAPIMSGRDNGASLQAAPPLGHSLGRMFIYPPAATSDTSVPVEEMPGERQLPSDVLQQTVADPASGRPLDPITHGRLAQPLGHDLSKIRIHTDAEADGLARELRSRAFTMGSHIFFRDGAYQPATREGLHLLAHETTHTVQQAQLPRSEPGRLARITVADRMHPAEREADQRAEQVVGSTNTPNAEPALMTGEAPTAAMAGVSGQELLVQGAPDDANPAPAASPATQAAPGAAGRQQAPAGSPAAAGAQPAVARNDVELMGVRLKSRQVDLATFLDQVKKDANDIRAYFRWVNGVYERCYGHYELVMKQAKEQYDTQQAWADHLAGVVTGMAVGLLAEAILPLDAAAATYQYLGEVAAEAVEGGIARLTKSDAEPWTIVPEAQPAFKQVAALQQLDKLNAKIISMAVPGAYVYSDPIIRTERLTAELRVAEAKGERRMTDLEIQGEYLKLMQFEAASILLENQLKNAEPKFQALRTAYMGKQAPTDQRCEQDIWIPWIAKQNTSYDSFWSISIPVMNEQLVNHFVDIGLAARGARGGRLNADVSQSHRQWLPEGGAHGISRLITPAEQLVLGAQAELAKLPAYWQDVFLMGQVAGAKDS